MPVAHASTAAIPRSRHDELMQHESMAFWQLEAKQIPQADASWPLNRQLVPSEPGSSFTNRMHAGPARANIGKNRRTTVFLTARTGAHHRRDFGRPCGLLRRLAHA